MGGGGVIFGTKAILKDKYSIRYLIMWCGACLVTMAIYFIGYESTPSETTSLEAVQHPIAFITYLVAYIGAPLAPIEGAASTILGLSAFAYAIYFLRRIHWELELEKPSIRMGLCLMVLACGCAFLTGLKQWPEGPDQAISFRYLVWSTMFWIGLLVLSTRAAEARRVRQCLLAQVLVLGVAASLYGAYRADERHTAFELGKEALLMNTSEEHLVYVYPTSDVPHAMRKNLVKYKLSIFRNASERIQGDE